MNEMNEQYWQKFLAQRRSRRHMLSLITAAGAGGAILACSGKSTERVTGPTSDPTDETPDAERPAGWTEASHSNKVEPDYATVFPTSRAQQMTITVSPENWQAMLDNMTSLFGERGIGQGGGATGQAPGGDPGAAGGPPGGGQPGGGFASENPMWAPATVALNGRTWTNVGLRFKGNSSLRSSWGGGTDKLPFKLDFDEFEEDYPEIKNQRFYGFKQLSLANNWGDAAQMREALTYELLGEFGLVAAKTGFYEILLDHGDGVKSLGMYTVIEVIDDTVIRRSFSDAGGNIYEAEGSAASFATGTDAAIETSFEVESDESQVDWNDIRELYAVLHSATRTSDPGTWRAGIEEVFDVGVFLEWLAFSALLQHWDTYGGMTHNFYLYNDPAAGRLTWISWDHNLVLGAGGGGGRAPAGNAAGGGAGGGRSNVSFDKSAVGENWPLISYLIAQAPYKARYDAALAEIIRGVFEPAKVAARIRQLADLLAPYAAKESSDATYRAALETLASLPAQRVEAAKAYLGTV